MGDDKPNLRAIVLPKPIERAGPTDPTRHPWVGRVGIFELSTGTKVQGKIIAVHDEYFETDNGAIKKSAVVYARWCGAEEISIIRGGPLTPRW